MNPESQDPTTAPDPTPAADPTPVPEPATTPDPTPAAVTELYNIRLVVDRIEGRSVCGMKVGDYCEITNSSQLRMPTGGHFCFYALAAALPLIPAKQRQLPAGDWLEQDSEIACPDPEERLIMRIERSQVVRHASGELT